MHTMKATSHIVNHNEPVVVASWLVVVVVPACTGTVVTLVVEVLLPSVPTLVQFALAQARVQAQEAQ